jgi:acyl phosphate:glycerol-3-phosphate acyltransferase
MITPLNFTVIICSYLLGSISSAILLCRLLKLPDPREYGSKNPGATNAFRIGGKKLAATVLLLDFLKGFLTIWVAQSIEPNNFITALAGLSVFLGQLFPVFFSFRGGKGLAIAFGIVSAAYWQLALLLLAIWLLIFRIFKISSLAAIITITLTFIITFWLPDRSFAICLGIISLLILFRHKQNIKNLFNKTESKIIIK